MQVWRCAQRSNDFLARVHDAHCHALLGRYLPAVNALRRHHVETAVTEHFRNSGRNLRFHDTSNLTLWIHSSTISIERNCFEVLSKDSTMHRWHYFHSVLVRTAPTPVGGRAPQTVVAAAALGALVEKIRAYEPALVDLIRKFMPGIDEIHRVGDHAFARCTAVKDVILPPLFTHIGEGAFEKSTLTHVTLPDALTRIEGHAFDSCRCLMSVTLPKSLTHVGESAFSECSGLQSVNLHACKSLTHIGDDAFGYCSNLKEVALPESLTYLGSEAFYGCLSLQAVILPNSLTRIRSNTFRECGALQIVVLPNALTHIYKRAFYGCNQLTEMTLPRHSLTHVARSAFATTEVDRHPPNQPRGVEAPPHKHTQCCTLMSCPIVRAQIVARIRELESIDETQPKPISLKQWMWWVPSYVEQYSLRA
jgi:hypothetical protein